MTAEFLRKQVEMSRAELKQAILEHESLINKFMECVNKGANPTGLKVPTTENIHMAFDKWKNYDALLKYESVK